jgi:hypothetical protein
MTSFSKDWRHELVEFHPKLFGPPHIANGHLQCGEGWRDLLEIACSRIESAMAHGDSVKLNQVREKYGTLRIYWTGTVSDRARILIEEAVALATARSACTCEICGNAGSLHSRGTRLSTQCRQHATGDRVPIRAELENLHIVHAAGPDGASTISCRRYIRDTDTFEAVDSRSLGNGCPR